MTASPLISHRRPPIVFATLSLDVGGAERQIVNIAPALVARGWPVSIFCFNRTGVLADHVRHAGVEVIGPPLSARGRETARPVRAVFSTIAAGRLARVLRSKHPAIVHFFLTEPYLLGAPAALLARAPIQLMSRRETTAEHRGVAKVRSLESHLHPRMSAVLGNARRVVDDLRHEGCPPDRLGLIYNGVDLTPFDRPFDRAAMRHTLGLGDDDLAAVMVANLISYKGHADLLDALGKLASGHPLPLKLFLIGRDDGCRASLEQQARQLGIADRVVFLGQRADVADIVRAVDIGIHTSHTEGFSNAIIESMAAGLPMIVTDVGGNAEAVGEGKEGFVVPAHAPERIVGALAKVITDGALRRRFGTAARNHVDRKFSLGAAVDRYEALYRGLIAGLKPAQIPEIAVDQR